MFNMKSEEVCFVCKRRTKILIFKDNQWQCDGGCENQIESTRVKDALLESGNARQSIPEELKDTTIPQPVSLNAHKLEKEFPGITDLMNMLRSEFEPDAIKAEIRKTACLAFALQLQNKNYVSFNVITEGEMDAIWDNIAKFWSRRPSHL